MNWLSGESGEAVVIVTVTALGPELELELPSRNEAMVDSLAYLPSTTYA
jgi:hypothetical protein